MLFSRRNPQSPNKSKLHSERQATATQPISAQGRDATIRRPTQSLNTAFQSETPNIILPKSTITALIIEHEHLLNLHAGTQAALYALRRSYWPIDGRSQVWRPVKRCVRCCRANPPSVDYVIGDLPAARITESRPFTNVGIDYCGPFYIKERKDRNRRKIKAYMAIFVCLSAKAVHIELVSDLTSEAFIAALRRFIARRGFCSSIYSDNGTNFVGANNELRGLRNLLRSDDHKISQILQLIPSPAGSIFNRLSTIFGAAGIESISMS
jgi:hypothetical protein